MVACLHVTMGEAGLAGATTGAAPSNPTAAMPPTMKRRKGVPPDWLNVPDRIGAQRERHERRCAAANSVAALPASTGRQPPLDPPIQPRLDVLDHIGEEHAVV